VRDADELISSPLLRATQTADAFGGSRGHSHPIPAALDDFAERADGDAASFLGKRQLTAI
jgi:broad specificity phosphatase PhoE